MNAKFCDRCKKQINYAETKSLVIKNHLAEYLLDKEICKECANDIINIIDYECDRFKLDTVVTISKEAE